MPRVGWSRAACHSNPLSTGPYRVRSRCVNRSGGSSGTSARASSAPTPPSARPGLGLRGSERSFRSPGPRRSGGFPRIGCLSTQSSGRNSGKSLESAGGHRWRTGPFPSGRIRSKRLLMQTSNSTGSSDGDATALAIIPAGRPSWTVVITVAGGEMRDRLTESQPVDRTPTKRAQPTHRSPLPGECHSSHSGREHVRQNPGSRHKRHGQQVRHGRLLIPATSS